MRPQRSLVFQAVDLPKGSQYAIAALLASWATLASSAAWLAMRFSTTTLATTATATVPITAFCQPGKPDHHNQIALIFPATPPFPRDLGLMRLQLALVEEFHEVFRLRVFHLAVFVAIQ